MEIRCFHTIQQFYNHDINFLNLSYGMETKCFHIIQPYFVYKWMPTIKAIIWKPCVSYNSIIYDHNIISRFYLMVWKLHVSIQFNPILFLKTHILIILYETPMFPYNNPLFYKICGMETMCFHTIF